MLMLLCGQSVVVAAYTPQQIQTKLDALAKKFPVQDGKIVTAAAGDRTLNIVPKIVEAKLWKNYSNRNKALDKPTYSLHDVILNSHLKEILKELQEAGKYIDQNIEQKAKKLKREQEIKFSYQTLMTSLINAINNLGTVFPTNEITHKEAMAPDHKGMRVGYLPQLVGDTLYVQNGRDQALFDQFKNALNTVIKPSLNAELDLPKEIQADVSDALEKFKPYVKTILDAINKIQSKVWGVSGPAPQKPAPAPKQERPQPQPTDTPWRQGATPRPQPTPKPTPQPKPEMPKQALDKIIAAAYILLGVSPQRMAQIELATTNIPVGTPPSKARQMIDKERSRLKLIEIFKPEGSMITESNGATIRKQYLEMIRDFHSDKLATATKKYASKLEEIAKQTQLQTTDVSVQKKIFDEASKILTSAYGYFKPIQE